MWEDDILGLQGMGKAQWDRRVCSWVSWYEHDGLNGLLCCNKYNEQFKVWFSFPPWMCTLASRKSDLNVWVHSHKGVIDILWPCLKCSGCYSPGLSPVFRSKEGSKLEAWTFLFSPQITINPFLFSCIFAACFTFPVSATHCGLRLQFWRIHLRAAALVLFCKSPHLSQYREQNIMRW